MRQVFFVVSKTEGRNTRLTTKQPPINNPILPPVKPKAKWMVDGRRPGI